METESNNLQPLIGRIALARALHGDNDQFRAVFPSVDGTTHTGDSEPGNTAGTGTGAPGDGNYSENIVENKEMN